MLIGSKSLNSILGSWDPTHSSAFLKAEGALANTEADPAGVLGGYSWSGSNKVQFDCSQLYSGELVLVTFRGSHGLLSLRCVRSVKGLS